MRKRHFAAVAAALLSCLCLWPGRAAADETAAVSGDSLGVRAEAYILVEATTGRVLAGENTQERLPIASITKILTALITLEQPGLEEYFTVDANAIRVEGSSMGLREGDQASLYSLAAGMLLTSGNDAANAAAVRIAGSLSAFAQQMNARAAEIGMVNSHFVTPSGLHDDEHYSTAEDMALLGRVALQNELFAELCSQTSLKLRYGNPPFDRWLENHNKLLKYFPGCIGIKTGYTKKAGRTLVSAAQRDGVTLVCVTLNDPNDWNDHGRLYEYGFSQVTPTSIAVETEGLSLPVVGGISDTVAVRALGETLACVTAEQEPELTQTILLPRFGYAPIREGDVVGEIVHFYHGFEAARTTLVAADDVAQAALPAENFWRGLGEFVEEHFRF